MGARSNSAELGGWNERSFDPRESEETITSVGSTSIARALIAIRGGRSPERDEDERPVASSRRRRETAPLAQAHAHPRRQHTMPMIGRPLRPPPQPPQPRLPAVTRPPTESTHDFTFVLVALVVLGAALSLTLVRFDSF